MRPLHASWLAVTPEPWKNGGGVTRTLSVDAAQQPPRWRVSVADIDRDGPYSRFPGYDRVSVVLTGGGVELVADAADGAEVVDVADVADAGRIRLAPGVATAFAGDAGFQSRLVNGPVRVLNLFVLRGAAAASVVCVGGGQSAVEAGGLAQDGASTHTLRIVVAAQAGRLNQAAADASVALAAGDYVVDVSGVSCGIDARQAFAPAQATARDGVAAVVLDVRVPAPAAV